MHIPDSLRMRRPGHADNECVLTRFGPTCLQTATHDVAEYLLDQNTWVSKAPLIFGRLTFAVAYASGSVYAFGGMGSAVCSPSDNCRHRAITAVEAFADVDYPPVFIYQKGA